MKEKEKAVGERKQNPSIIPGFVNAKKKLLLFRADVLVCGTQSDCMSSVDASHVFALRLCDIECFCVDGTCGAE